MRHKVTWLLLALATHAASAFAEPGCPSQFALLGNENGHYAMSKLDRLESQVAQLPQPFRWKLARSLRSAMAPLAENAEPWQISERVEAINALEKSLGLLQKIMGGSPSGRDATEAWVDRTLLRKGLMDELKRRGLDFKPEERGRIARTLLRLGRSRALSFFLNPIQIPPRDLDLVPPELLERVLANGIESERPALEEALGHSPARFHQFEQGLRKLLPVIVPIVGGYNGYRKFRADQEAAEEKAKEDFFRNLDNLDNTVQDLQTQVNKLKEQEAGRNKASVTASPQ
jgi:hypothetical protein